MVGDLEIQSSKIDWKAIARTMNPERVRNVMVHEDKSWRFWLLVMGFMQLVASRFLNPSWGIMLILIAVVSLYFRSAAMLPVYGVTMAFAAASNLLSGQGFWLIFGLLQIYWAYNTFRQFLILRRSADRLRIGLGLDSSGKADRAASLFPWAGCALSAAAPTVLVAAIILMVASTLATGQEPDERLTRLAEEALVYSALLGLALAVAALLARYRRRTVSILAAIGSGLMIGLILLAAVAL